MKKGFTLIELLAVIVILAIIALIATPIILGIINDAREESNERSVELYANAVKNGIANQYLNGANKSLAGTYDETNPLPFTVDYEGNVECKKIEIYEDGRVYVEGCKVNGVDKEYNYGPTKEGILTPEEDAPSTQEYKPQYYSWSYGSINGDLPGDAKTTVTELNPRYPFYLGLDVDSNNKVTAAYACFIRTKDDEDVEYCLKGTTDGSAYSENDKIIKDAYSGVVDTDACSFDDGVSYCIADGLTASAASDGFVRASNFSAFCDVYENGTYSCSEF